MELTQKIAFLISQLDKSQIRSIKIDAYGDIENYLDSLITFAIVGALSNSSSNEKLNYVNAKFIAKEKNIQIQTKKQPNNTAYKNKINIKITTTNSTNTISGTVFVDDIHRVIDINGYEIDIEPSGSMLFVQNSDVPGVVGEIGKILGDQNINISDFRLGRHKDKALALILVDSDIDEVTINKISNLKPAKQVCFVKI
jgi:D-3-phosphoglycerate dehydrogenase